VAFAHLTAVTVAEDERPVAPPPGVSLAPPSGPLPPPVAPPPAGAADPARLLGRLADVWAEFERRLAGVPIVERIEAGEATLADYRNLLLNLRQQVAEGARWITRAASSIAHDKIDLRAEFVRHAATEQLDFQMLERDYCSVGGRLADIQGATKNIGSAALSAFMFHQADQPDPLDLLGAMFVIEGLGANKALGWARLLADQLDLRADQLTFLHHHGEADADHTATLRTVLSSDWITAEVADAIVHTARTVARLYALQLEELDERHGTPMSR
jgi:3-oxoacyl-[acyl-carrier-protein] synthase-3